MSTTIENYAVGSTAVDANITVQQAYDASGRLGSVTAVNPDTGDQVTTYVWGVEAPKSDLASNQLLREMRFPGDKLDVVGQAYNRLGQVKEWTDQNGTVHAYTFDKLGRMTADELVALGLDIDGAVTKIGLAFDVRGLVEKITSYDSSNTVVNEVLNEFNDLGQVTKQYQEHSGAKSGSTPFVEYAYDSTAPGTEYTKDSRRTRRDFPNGDDYAYGYGSAGSAGDKMSRVENLNDTSDNWVEYQYLGLGRFVVVYYPTPEVTMTLDEGGMNRYEGLDRFSRIVDMPWLDTETNDIDRFKYGYDRASNPLHAFNDVDTNFGNQYAYDELDRLIDAKRGSISGGAVADPDHREAFDLDATGNWTGYYVEDDGTTTWKQRRAFNESNEITDLTNWVSPEYDLAGNMTTIPQPSDPTSGYSLVWDGWNRLKKVLDGTTVVEEYLYDGLTRRLTSDDQTDVRHFFYSMQWQVLEERLNALTTADKQYVWGIRYIDDLVMRVYDESERIYVTKDRMWSIRTLIDGSEYAILQRFIYNPYGESTVLDDSFSPTTDGYDWEYRFQGRRWDRGTGEYMFRFRYYSCLLGRFLGRDRLMSVNMFEFAEGSPSLWFDPLGLDGDTSNNGGGRKTKKSRVARLSLQRGETDDLVGPDQLRVGIRGRNIPIPPPTPPPIGPEDFPKIFQSVPDCPCCEHTIRADSRFVPELSGVSAEFFHAGATRCYRSKSKLVVYNGILLAPGQQCCYKHVDMRAVNLFRGTQRIPDSLRTPEIEATLKCSDSGILITSGTGAGSQDLHGPSLQIPQTVPWFRKLIVWAANVALHQYRDVLPWIGATAFLGKRRGVYWYNAIWGANKGVDELGRPCPEISASA